MTVRPAGDGAESATRAAAPPVARRSSLPAWWRSNTSRRLAFGYLLLAPAALYVALLVGIPFLFSLYLAVSDANVGDQVANFVGLENFRAAWEMETFWIAQRTHRQKEIRRHLLLYAGMTPFLFIAVFPIYWMAVTAFKQESDLYRMGNIPFWFNLPPTLKNFETLFYQTNYGSWIINTLTISAWVALITLVTAVPAGYALARLRLPGAENIGIAIFMTYLVPGIILFLPLSRVVASLGLQDSWWALVVVYPTFTIPFCTWLMMGFFKTVPMEMEEAARVDGCGQLGALIRVILPVSLPGILTSVIFAFTLSMQDFLYGLAFVAPGDQKPVPVGVPTELIRGDVFFWGSIMAAALLVGLPVAILYNFFLDKFIQGITGGVGK